MKAEDGSDEACTCWSCCLGHREGLNLEFNVRTSRTSREQRARRETQREASLRPRSLLRDVLCWVVRTRSET